MDWKECDPLSRFPEPERCIWLRKDDMTICIDDTALGFVVCDHESRRFWSQIGDILDGLGSTSGRVFRKPLRNAILDHSRTRSETVGEEDLTGKVSENLMSLLLAQTKALMHMVSESPLGMTAVRSLSAYRGRISWSRMSPLLSAEDSRWKNIEDYAKAMRGYVEASNESANRMADNATSWMVFIVSVATVAGLFFYDWSSLDLGRIVGLGFAILLLTWLFIMSWRIR